MLDSLHYWVLVLDDERASVKDWVLVLDSQRRKGRRVGCWCSILKGERGVELGAVSSIRDGWVLVLDIRSNFQL